MRAAHIDPERRALDIRETPVPTVHGTSSVLIRVSHAGVNRPDVLQRKGVYPPPPGASPLPGLEVAGTVVGRGDGVPSEAFPQVGAQVCALTDGGGYAEFCAVPYGQCLPIPVGTSELEAACLPENCYTVWHNLFQQTNVFGERMAQGKAILVHGGSSGIGYTAIQMAKHRGLTVYATAGNAQKCNACKSFGADAVMDYHNQDWVSKVNELGGVDMVLDMVCGEYIDLDLQVLRRGGRIAIIGSQGGPVAPNIDFRRAMRNWLTISGSTIRARSTEDKASIAAELQEHVWPMYADGSARVVVDSAFPLGRANEAHERMESSQHIGKIVLTMES